MKFIRENLFLLILVGAVVVLGGGLLAVDASVGDDVDGEIAQRTQFATRLKNYTNPGNLVNDAIVAAEANRVRMIVQEANSIVQDQRQKNQFNTPYQVLSLPVIEGQQVKAQQPAFPFDAKMYTNYGLTMQFITLHRAQTGTLMQVLEPTHAATAADAETELRVLMSLMPAPAAPGPAAGATPSAAPVAGTSADISTLMRQKAGDYADYAKASLGRIYLDDAVTNEVTFAEGAKVADEGIEALLWRKQYKLWIATDLIAAIKATNDEALKGLPRLNQNVCNAAVKRWVSLNVADAYSSRSGEAGATPSAAPAPAPTPEPSGLPAAPAPSSGGGMIRSGPGPGRPGPGGEGRVGMGPGGGGAYATEGYSGSMGGTGGVQATAETCTQHYTDQEKDVLQYAFQVVMPTRHVPLLMTKLTQSRNHAVLAYKAQEAARMPGYFYSNEPVMLVTFTCEAIFLTSWERDLVPPAFLRTMPDSALRDKDKQRLR